MREQQRAATAAATVSTVPPVSTFQAPSGSSTGATAGSTAPAGPTVPADTVPSPATFPFGRLVHVRDVDL